MAGADDLAAERRALVETLRAVGPDAPTLVDGWRAADIAAHVAATEQANGVPTFLGRTLVVRRAWRLNDTFRWSMAIDLKRFRRHGFDWALRRLERPSPRLLARPSVLPVSVFEVYVHHEDVRRANGVERTIPVPDLGPSIEWLRRYQRLGEVDVQGEPGEVVLWMAGRPGADVEVGGDVPPGLRV